MMTKGLLGLMLACLHAQNFGIGTPTPTERLDVEGGRLRVRAYSCTGTRLATVDPTSVFGTLARSAPGDILQWNGTSWVTAPATSTAWQLTQAMPEYDTCDKLSWYYRCAADRFPHQ